jgi:hypothetical protein
MRRISLVLSLGLAACGRGMPADSPDAGVEVDADNGPDGQPNVQSEVYGHSRTVLYRIDANNLDVIEIGSFGAALGNQGMTDIAVDKNDRMIGVTLDKIFEVNPETGAATHLADFDGTGNLTSLSFVPVDPDDPDSAERLVTVGDAGNVYEISLEAPTLGEATLLGNFGMNGADQIVSSGDMVSVRGLGTFATVNITDNFDDPDYLAQIDTTTWEATPLANATCCDQIFGLGYWGGTFFGFVDNATTPASGRFVTIDPDTGESTPATNQNFAWWGAGVTTKAPIVP